MLQMLRSAAASFHRTAAPAARSGKHPEFTVLKDGRPFLIVNAPSVEHAQFVVAGFPAGHAWMIVAR